MPLRKDKRSSFSPNSKLGKELNEIWDTLLINQIIPSNGMQIKRTGSGTVLTAPTATNNQEAASSTGGGGGVTSFKFARNSLALAGSVTDKNNLLCDQNGWLESPYLHTDLGNLLLTPLTLEMMEKQAASGINSGTADNWFDDHRFGPPAGTMRPEEWGGLYIAHPEYIKKDQVSHHWHPAHQLPDKEYVDNQELPTHYYLWISAIPLQSPLPSFIYYDSLGNDQTMPQMDYIQVSSGTGEWKPNVNPFSAFP